MKSNHAITFPNPELMSSFPREITLHLAQLKEGGEVSVYVWPEETFGKALARLGHSPSAVEAVRVPDCEPTYRPEFASATRPLLFWR